MAENADVVYKDAETILADLIAAWQTRIPDMNFGADSVARIWSIVFANTTEGLYLMAQLLHDDMFIQTQNALALMRSGEMYGRPQKTGTLATGVVRFGGAGGTVIPLGTEVAAPRAAEDDPLLFSTTASAVVPNPGTPTAPVAADQAVGVLAAGTYEFGITFVTVEGETEIGAVSNAVAIAINRQIRLTAIPLGGPGTVARSVYRRVDGGAWQKITDATIVAALNNNSAVTVDYNGGTLGGLPPDESTAERISVTATAVDSGVDYNVAVGAITDLSEVVSGVAEVTNLATFTGGTDDEDIETFREELLKRVRAPQSGSPADLETWATDIDGVESAKAFPNLDLAGSTVPGTTTVRISGPGGIVPDAGVVTATQDYLRSKDLANITVLVGTFTPNPIAVTVTVTPDTGYTVADLTASVQQAITDYINSVQVGGTVWKAGVIDAVFGLAGVVNVTSTFTDTTNTSVQKPTPGTITVS